MRKSTVCQAIVAAIPQTKRQNLLSLQTSVVLGRKTERKDRIGLGVGAGRETDRQRQRHRERDRDRQTDRQREHRTDEVCGENGTRVERMAHRPAL